MRRLAASAARAARRVQLPQPPCVRQLCAAPPVSPDALSPPPSSRGRSAAAAEQAAATFAGHLQHAPRATADALAASLSEKQREALMVRTPRDTRAIHAAWPLASHAAAARAACCVGARRRRCCRNAGGFWIALAAC
jgi:hypothetical protein